MCLAVFAILTLAVVLAGDTRDSSALASGVTAVSAGDSHTCAVASGGTAMCWGRNSGGQLGDGTTADSTTPVNVAELPHAAAISAGTAYTCAVDTTGGVKCWGDNGHGQLGDGTIDGRAVPTNVIGLGAGAAAVSAGDAHACAIIKGAGVKCWGSNAYGQLGTGTIATSQTCYGLACSLTPVDVPDLTGDVRPISAGSISAGSGYTCALTSESGVKCWGHNNYGQLGDGTTIDRSAPVDVAGLTGGVIAISADDAHTCAIVNGGIVECWGRNDSGELGNGTNNGPQTCEALRACSTTPVEVEGLTGGASAIAAGAGYTCILTTAGAVKAGGVKCWGWNFYGSLGNGSTADSNAPTDVVGLASGVTNISAGQAHACAVTAQGAVKCWGYNVSGQLGNGTTTNSSTPVDVRGMPAGSSSRFDSRFLSIVVAAAVAGGLAIASTAWYAMRRTQRRR